MAQEEVVRSSEATVLAVLRPLTEDAGINAFLSVQAEQPEAKSAGVPTTSAMSRTLGSL